MRSRSGRLSQAAAVLITDPGSQDPSVVRVHRGVAAAAADQGAVDREGGPERDEEADGEAPPEEEVPKARFHGSRDDQDKAVVHDLHHGDRDSVGGERDPGGLAQRDSAPYQRSQRQRVTEEEREHYGDPDRGGVAPIERGRDDEPEDLADRAAREAVPGGAEGRTVQRLRLPVMSPSHRGADSNAPAPLPVSARRGRCRRALRPPRARRAAVSAPRESTGCGRTGRRGSRPAAVHAGAREGRSERESARASRSRTENRADFFP